MNERSSSADPSSLDRCFLAVLETNLNLTIRSTEKDYIQGAWLDVRETLIEPALCSPPFRQICNLTDESYKLSAESPVVERDLSNPNPEYRKAKELLFQCKPKTAASVFSR